MKISFKNRYYSGCSECGEKADLLISMGASHSNDAAICVKCIAKAANMLEAYCTCPDCGVINPSWFNGPEPVICDSCGHKFEWGEGHIPVEVKSEL